MTDGIIQNILDEYINMEINAKKKGYSQMHQDYETVLKNIKQELINAIQNYELLAYKDNNDKQSQELLAIMKGILDELVNIRQELYLNRIGDKGL